MIRILLSALCLALIPIAYGASPSSLSEAFRSVPPPPATAAIATLWVQDGRVAAAEIVELEAALDAARRQALADASAASEAPEAATGDVPPAVKQVIDGYHAYRGAHEGVAAPAAALGARVQWLARRFSGLHKRVDGTGRAAEVHEQELAAYRALFTDWQSARAPIVARAQAELAAVGDPGAIASTSARAAVQRYRAAMIEETQVLLGLTRFAIERAAGLAAAEPGSVTPSATTLWDLMSDARKTPP